VARYDTDLDLTDAQHRNGSQAQEVELVGSGARVLDVGCATGYLARALRDRGCRVWGIDRDAEAAEQARPFLEELVVADLDGAPLTDHFEKGAFDVLVFGDVLEHVADPARVLRDALPLLAEDGRVVCSIPNITHGSVRLALLQGRWTYTETGLLDGTHVRFFDRAGVQALHDQVGLTVDVLRGVVLDPLGTEVDVDADALPASVIAWVREQEDSYVYQFLTSARRARSGDSRELPELVPAVPVESVRLDDQHVRRHAEELQAVEHLGDLATLRETENAELRHTVMTQRDHIIGLEAMTATARARGKVLTHRLTVAERQLERRKTNAKQQRAQIRALRATKRRFEIKTRRFQKENGALKAQVREMQGSFAWRIGRVITSPARALRRGR
jgi:2-polyprenyl-3-methyl-5-hydroxy-6-metoxy-1,4-benzoquinol methylase